MDTVSAVETKKDEAKDTVRYEWLAEYSDTGICVRLIERRLKARAGDGYNLEFKELKHWDFSKDYILQLVRTTYTQLNRFSAVHYYAARRRRFGSIDYRVPELFENKENDKAAQDRMEAFLFDEISNYNAPYTADLIKAINGFT